MVAESQLSEIEQLNQVFAQLAPIAHYLARVKARMIEQNFPPDDELF